MPLLRKVTSRELRELYRHMQRDFPANERLPYHMLKTSVLHGRMQACYLQEEEGTICGYAVCVLPPKSNYYHIQYIAILPEHRSKGYGGRFLEMLTERFGGRKIVLEVEDPEKAENEEDRILREKRIAFYQRAGLRLIDHMVLHLFGVPMLCMTNDPEPLPDPKTLWLTCYLMATGNRRWMLRFVNPVVHQPDLGEHGAEDGDYANLIPIGIYRHFKGGKYRVLHLARHSETLEVMVVYQALYGHKGVWTRPAAMWGEKVNNDGVMVTRFTYLGREEA